MRDQTRSGSISAEHSVQVRFGDHHAVERIPWSDFKRRAAPMSSTNLSFAVHFEHKHRNNVVSHTSGAYPVHTQRLNQILTSFDSSQWF